jgi:hypothetical protein
MDGYTTKRVGDILVRDPWGGSKWVAHHVIKTPDGHVLFERDRLTREQAVSIAEQLNKARERVS